MLAVATLASVSGSSAAVPAGRDRSTGTCAQRDGVLRVSPRDATRQWVTDYLCGNRPDAPLYADPGYGRKVAVMTSTTSWFVCWTTGADTIWYFTQGDYAERDAARYGMWGYMPAAEITVAQHPWPGMPHC